MNISHLPEHFWELYEKSSTEFGLRYQFEEVQKLSNASHVVMATVVDPNPVGIILAFDMVVWTYIDVLYVVPELRGHGIGKKLINLVSGKSLELCWAFDDIELDRQMCQIGFTKTGNCVWGIK